MSHIQIEIENLVLSGFSMGPAGGRRLAALTQTALERLVRERGISAAPRGPGGYPPKTAQLKQRPDTGGSSLALELAEILYRMLDRKA
jgi:hypothetical protein